MNKTYPPPQTLLDTLPEWLQPLANKATIRPYKKRSRIIQAGDQSRHLFYIISGSVSVLASDSQEREIVLAYLNEGDFFGELGLFDPDASRSAFVTARSDCNLMQINYQQLSQLTSVNPTLLFSLASQMASRLRNTSRKVVDLAFLDVTGRIAACLLELAQQPDAKQLPNDLTQISITRQEISNIVGCSREMAGRVIKDLQEHQLITVDGKAITILRGRK